ncbi:uncharacterized protein [Asterias amurensis]|uniref:uncharacterized protein n=1 Tax=Asterias amurensis TaxID=7602 RepID=UPI003AB7D90E
MGCLIVYVLPRRCVLMMTTLLLLNTIEPHTAQPSDISPLFLIEFVDLIRELFCEGCPTNGAPCMRGMQPTLCQHACQNEGCRDEQCPHIDDWSIESNISCTYSQETLCIFEDAVICQDAEDKGVCVFKKLDEYESVSLCKCKSQPGAEDDYQLWKNSCNEDEDREPFGGEKQSTEPPPSDGKPTLPMTKVPPIDNTGGMINIAVPILCSLLVVVLVVLLVLAVKLCRQRSGNPALLNNKTPNGTNNSTSEELKPNVSKRASQALPLVPSEYPQSCSDDHTYYSLDHDVKDEGSSCYVIHEKNSAPSQPDKVVSTEDADHKYSVLEKTQSIGNIGVSDPDYTTSTEAPVEAESDRSPVLMMTEESDTPLKRYGYEVAVVAPPKENIRSPVNKTAESETNTVQSGYEVAVVAPSKENTRSPLDKPAESETINVQSGYEVAVVAPPKENSRSPVHKPAENKTASVQSGYEVAVVAPSKENIRSPVHKPAESETSNDQSGYEVAVVATPRADPSDSALYDHFDRSTSRLSSVGDPPDQENSDYQHLVKV